MTEAIKQKLNQPDSPIVSEPSLHDKILEAIKNKKVKMQPKWHYGLKTILVIIGVVILFMTLLYLASFIIFMLHQTGGWFAPSFGFRGWHVLLVSFPWLLLLLSLIFIIILETLVNRYAFAYRYPLLYSVFGIIMFVLIGGFIVAATPFHDKLSKFSKDNRIPIAGKFYRELGQRQFDHIYLGKITEPGQNEFLIESRLGEILRATVASSTRLPLGNNNFFPGENVVIFGDRHDNVVDLIGVRKIGQ